jgi:hypothetical protein
VHDHEHQGGDDGDRQNDQAERAAPGVAAALAAAAGAQTIARRRQGDGRLGRLLLRRWLRKEERGYVVDV